MKRPILFSYLLLIATSAQAGVIQNQTILTGGLSTTAGMPLYTFDKDAPGVSNCNGACASVWPPVLVTQPSDVPTGFKTLKRQDGSLQLADDEGHALYTFVQDTPAGAGKPAVARGHGLREFYLAAPARASR